MGNAEQPPPDGAWGRRVLGIALGAAAVGGLGVWLYLRVGGNPQHRAAQRIEELQHRLNELEQEVARYSQSGGAARGVAGG